MFKMARLGHAIAVLWMYPLGYSIMERSDHQQCHLCAYYFNFNEVRGGARYHLATTRHFAFMLLPLCRFI